MKSPDPHEKLGPSEKRDKRHLNPNPMPFGTYSSALLATYVLSILGLFAKVPAGHRVLGASIGAIACSALWIVFVTIFAAIEFYDNLRSSSIASALVELVFQEFVAALVSAPLWGTALLVLAFGR